MDKQMQLINIARQKLGIDDETWRGQILPRFGGKPDQDGRISLKSLTPTARGKLLKELEGKGFNNTAKQTDWRGPYIMKITTIWRLMAANGVVRNPSQTALNAWAKKVSGVDKLEWASAEKLRSLIEALKSWAQREGFGVRYVGEHRYTELYRIEDAPAVSHVTECGRINPCGGKNCQCARGADK